VREHASAKIRGAMDRHGDARVALLGELVDHAPLFPPASLPLPDALEEDARARVSRDSFMLGRFVCLASQLSELPDLGRGISVVLDAALADDPRVEAAETRPSFDLGAGVPRVGEVYVETPLDDTLEDRLDHVAELGLRAKVRCGGAAVPDAESLALFIRSCREREIVFKATAGLHHAVRSDGEHGFLNLLAAVVFGDEVHALDETDPTAFELDAESFSWRGRSASAGELAAARRERFHSIGSCSFFEPVEELEALGVLPL
jgi:hypothetical protein